MVIALLALFCSIYLLSNALDEYRFEQFVERSTAGPAKIMAKILQRRDEQGQESWVQLLNELAGSQLYFVNKRDLNLTRDQLEEIEAIGSTQRIDFSKSRATVYIEIMPGDERLLVANLSDVNDRVGRTLCLIILSEMKYQNIRDQGEEFNALIEPLEFPARIVSVDDEELTFAQKRMLQRNEMVVLLSDVMGQGATATVYAPLTRGGKRLLKLGEIKRFVWMPVGQAFFIIFISLLILALVAYILVSPLANRFSDLQEQVKSLDERGFDQEVKIKGNDDLALLAADIDGMAKRILALLQSQRELTSAVSHEIRTPIARMKFHLALMEDDEQFAEMLESSHIQGLHKDLMELEQLADEMLAYASLRSQVPNLNFQQADIANILKKAIDQTRALNDHASALDYELLISDEEPEYILDNMYLLRAVSNILGNAQRYAKHRIRISIEHTRRSLAIVIEDDGPGISKGFEKHIFDAFSRGDSSRSKHSGGYGLGLAIVFQIMRWHDGSISVEKSALGGARFTLSISKGLKISSAEEID